MSLKRKLGFVCGLALAFVAFSARPALADQPPLKVGYSDWPGWVAWDIAINKGWLKQAGVNVQFQWFDYSASLDAFSAGKIDGVFATNGDTLVTAGSGAKGIMIMLTDYSSGNDMIVARPGIRTVKQLKGKKVGIEIGLVEHLLLLHALKANGMKESDVTLVNTKTNDTPQVLASGGVDAIGAWQPNAGQAMQLDPGARPVYTSAKAPGLIYDVLTVNPATLQSRRADWLKLIKVWDHVVSYINDPKTQADAIKIMAARDGLTPAAYKPLVKGTHLIDVAEGKQRFKKGPGLSSLYGSSMVSDDFNVKNAIYKSNLNVDSYIDPSLTDAQ